MNAPLDDRLALLAEQAGVDVYWRDALDRPQSTPADTLRAVLRALDLPADSADDIEASLQRIEQERGGRKPPRLVTADVGDRFVVPVSPRGRVWKLLDDEHTLISEGQLPSGEGQLDAPSVPGYYTLFLDDDEVTLAVAPPRTFGIGDIAGARKPWGMAVQMSSLRRPGDGGIGDFTALETCAKAAAEKGADALAISPLHALFAAAPERYSPYAPSSRLFLNGLYVDPVPTSGEQTVRAVIDTHNLRQELAELEWLELIDWPRAARARMTILRSLFESASVDLAHSERFGAFRRAQGEPLERHARFEALHADFSAHGRPGGWQGWPAEFHDPAGREVAAFAREHSREVGFHAWLQWLATQGLEGAQKAARDAGMSIGLVADLAVGADSGGSHAWAHQAEVLKGLSVGAPPDALNRLGQDWGLTTFSPRGLRDTGFKGFIGMLRAALAHAGGVRIDHVLGLKRLWMVPHGAGATEGAYVRYPLTDMLRLIALESHLHRAIVIGEDLGTVPADFRQAIGDKGVLGIRVLWFERAADGGFVSPLDWSAKAMATTSTHDVPTVAGWWSGRDVEWRKKTGLDDPAVDENAQREGDRVLLWRAMCASGSAWNEESPPGLDDISPVVVAAAKHVAQAPAPLAIYPVEDILGLHEQPNLPGPTDAIHPNWRRRMPDSSSRLFDGPIAHAVCDVIDKTRNRT
ncbi:4-alpha-glucanotransferase [Luteibacter rhizovicinus DSM 16549]|uniref:4-alpha-glucanotransferase n=1 Tax=Luteibacter rhizovicinus DSM 16549 TaxID=1440763 RepID=A0A1L3EVY2_9GAMM|nr:4-alpha-glucanotransferase [Luteibacter rhizovicinus]APG05184.1 4-alpha-glucanotransferase [Luteibacter rhizovicinus DSM 16549]